MCLLINYRFVYMGNIIKPIKPIKTNRNRKKHGFFMFFFFYFEEKTWFFRFSWAKKPKKPPTLLKNISENCFIKSKLSLFTNKKSPQEELQFTFKKIQTTLLNRVDRILYVERRFQHPFSYTRDDQLFGEYAISSHDQFPRDLR